jgi:pyruvate dehydrogenase E2 component (dihydrolipoamide acetyltransferase)
MSESVNLPALGESVTEGTVTRWLKNVGDRVEVDEPLVEVSTDKVDTEIPSPIAGIIEAILVAEDETVEVGTALVTIGDGSAGGAPAAPAQEQAQTEAPEQVQETAAPAEAEPVPAEPEQAPAAQEPEPQPEPEPVAAQQPAAEAPAELHDEQPEVPAPTVPSTETPAAEQPAASTAAPSAPPAPEPAPTRAPGAHAGGGYVTPLVRKLANAHGVNLSTLAGTGVGGRIRKQDVLDAERPAAPTPAPVAAVSPLRGTTVPMSRLRKVVAERAVLSMQASAQLTTVVEVDVTLVAQFRDRVKDQFEDKTGVKLSFLPFFTLAAAEALKAYPVVNATIDGENIVYPGHENISIAVDTERGLLTPVIRNASDLDLAGIATQIADLADRTRNNKLGPDELAGGTFTVTNTGSRGALFDTPLVFLPQSAILGTGLVVKKPVVVSDSGMDAIAIRSVVYLALSYDHRVVDGADAARFLVAVKDRLEDGDFAGNLGI